LANNVVNVGAATLSSLITLALFGEHESALALGSFLLTFVILVFSEITPKVIGARYADQLAPWFAYPLALLLKIAGPVVAFVNLFVTGLLRLLRLEERQGNPLHTAEELRAMLESSRWRFQNQRELLLNSLALEQLTVADIMVPRRAIEAVDVSQPEPVVREQIATAYHTRLPLIDSRTDEILGIVHTRRLVAELLAGEPFSKNLLTQVAIPAYYIPGNTPVLAQLAEFQNRQQRLALVVDEYGELRGLVTLDDVLEEIIGQFTSPLAPAALTWDAQGTVTLPAEMAIRDVNRALGITLPLDRGRTLNGLLLSTLQTLPEGETALRFGSIVAEVLQTDNRSIRVVRLRRLVL
jgi:Mg2+/Co2+ transporter CorB